MSTFFSDTDFSVNTTAILGEQAAHHARVKRLDVGDSVQLTNGAGAIARGSIAAMKKSTLEIGIEDVRAVAAPYAIHLRAPIADRDRMLLLAEKVTELGIATWQSVRFKRSMSVSPRGDGAAFAEKLRARMISALEQSGGAWLPKILDEGAVSTLETSNDVLPIVLDVSGDALTSIMSKAEHRAAVVLVGPEGGIEDDEMTKLLGAGWKRARLAANTLRFETAGIAAVAALRSIYDAEER